MKIHHIILLFPALLIISCSTALTKQGEQVRPVTEAEKDKYSCKYLGLVSGSNRFGGNTAESAMNDARNAASKLGANGFLIVTSTTGTFWNNTANVNAQALRCIFPD